MLQWKQFLKVRQQQLVFIGFFSIFINLLMLVLPIYSLQIFDRVLSSRSAETLVLLAVLALGLLLLQAALEFIRSRLLHVGAVYFEHHCAPSLVSRALNIAGHSPDLSRRGLLDVNEVKAGLSSPMVPLLFDLPWTPIFILVIFSLHPLLGWFALAATLVLIGLTWLNLHLTRKNADDIAQKSFDSGAFLQRQIGLGRSIALFNVADNLAQSWHQQNSEVLALQNKANLRMQVLQSFIKYARMTLQVGVLGLGAWLVITNQAVAGVMLAASILLGRVLAPLDQSVNLWKPWRQSRQAFGRVAEVFAQHQDENRIAMPIDAIRLNVEALSVKDSFDRLILKNVQFELKAGHALAIVGSSGSGKSTLLNAIAGGPLTQQGFIRINDIAINEMLPQQRHELIGYLPQQVELFETSLFNNICCFETGKGVDEKVFAAAKLAGIHEFISKQPNAYQTEFGRKGVQLSGGEMQLLGLARALYHQPKLLLLDEPDSNLDLQSEQRLLLTLHQLKQQGVTIILISHRGTLIKVADWLVCLDKGSITDAGKKDDVLARLQKQAPTQINREGNHG